MALHFRQQRKYRASDESDLVAKTSNSLHHFFSHCADVFSLHWFFSLLNRFFSLRRFFCHCIDSFSLQLYCTGQGRRLAGRVFPSAKNAECQILNSAIRPPHPFMKGSFLSPNPGVWEDHLLLENDQNNCWLTNPFVVLHTCAGGWSPCSPFMKTEFLQ